jgi:hypothetical protein
MVKNMVTFKNFMILILFFSFSYSEIITTASSVLNNTNAYSHLNCIDGNFHTAWVEGSPSNGTGEWIKLDFSSEKPLSYIGLIPGYLKFSSSGENLYFSNNQIKKATLEFSDGTSKTVSFAKREAIQYVRIDKKTSHVKIIIDSVYEGTKYKDACISEIIPFFDGKPKYYNDIWNVDRSNSNPDNEVLLQPCYYFFIPPFSIEFENRPYRSCVDRLSNPFKVLNDSTYYTIPDEFGVVDGTDFILSSFDKKIIAVFGRSEYRWAFGGSESEEPLFYYNDSIGMNSASYCTAWAPLISIEGKYTIPETNKPKSQNEFVIQSVIPKKQVFQFFNSLLNNWSNPEYVKNSERIAKFATHIKIVYSEKGKVKNLYILLLKAYGEC